MFKSFFYVPDTFDTDERRRRVILNALLVIFMLMALLTIIVTLLFMGRPVDKPQRDLLIKISLLTMIAMSILLAANRSPKVPSWLIGIIVVAFLIAVISGTDFAHDLYNGRSLITWVLPIMVGAVILPPESVFIIGVLIFGLMQILTPSGEIVNYYAVMTLGVVAFISYVEMSIANNAIRTARHETANKQAILNSIVDGVVVIDLQGKLLSANPALFEMIPEKDLRQIISKPIEKTIHWNRKVFSVTVSPVPEVGTVAVFRDETRRYEIEHARDALLATGSHELRTPLAAVMNYLELLLMLSQMGKANSEEFSEHLNRALENSKRLQNLINDILDQAQIQAGVLKLNHQPFDLRAMFIKVGHLLGGLLQQKNLSYALAIAPDVPAKILGDPDRLHQVLVNLIGNGIKFTNQGGIDVKVSMEKKDKLSIQITDSGPGIPPEQLPDIFEAFRRGSNYAQRERQGAGLGLSIAREIVTLMGGEITVESQLGVGSTFTVIVPVETA
ncbi:MAG: ATP-binding protein [Anaerolineales bacterium]